MTALRLGELALEAGYPPGVLNVVPGRGHDAGAALSSHPDVDKLTFTGSTGVGKLIGKAATERMTRVTLELGGKSPPIVLEDADPQVAAQGAANAIFFNQGQVCCAGSRLYVHRKLFDNLVADISGIAEGIKLGNGLDPLTEMGPMVSSAQQKRVHGYIEQGRSEGAQIATGGDAFGPGFFMKPAALVEVNQHSSVVREEIFGPELVAMPFDDIDEVVRMANDSPYGLGASIWSNNLSEVHRVKRGAYLMPKDRFSWSAQYWEANDLVSQTYYRLLQCSTRTLLTTGCRNGKCGADQFRCSEKNSAWRVRFDNAITHSCMQLSASQGVVKQRHHQYGQQCRNSQPKDQRYRQPVKDRIV